MKTYAEVRFFKWQEADTSVSLRAKSGSCGGGGRGISDTGCNRNVKPWGACRKL